MCVPRPTNELDIKVVISTPRSWFPSTPRPQGPDHDPHVEFVHRAENVGSRDGQTIEVHDLAAPRAMNGWEIYPEALGGALRRTSRIATGTPIIVTENGIASADDVRGYLHWSLVDNCEWGSYATTFGLVAVDRETFERKPRPPLRWLGGQRC